MVKKALIGFTLIIITLSLSICKPCCASELMEHGDKAYDIVICSDFTYVLSSKSIIVLDKKNNVVRIITFPDNDFIIVSPTKLAVQNNIVYIVDEGNIGIIALDLSGEYRDYYDIAKLIDGATLFEIESIYVDDGLLYVCSNTTNVSNLFVININTHECIQTQSKVIGQIAKVKNDIVMAVSMTYFKDDNGHGYEQAQSYLANINTVYDKIFGFPSAYNPQTMRIVGNKIYIYSDYYGRIDAYDLEGQYLRCIYEGIVKAFDVDSSEKIFILTNNNINGIIEVDAGC